MPELTLTEGDFDQTVLSSDVPVFVDFWAPWCGPCRLMGPVVEELAKDLEGKAKVGKVNVDDHPSLAQRFNVMSIPTFVVFKGGKVVEQFSGALKKEYLVSKMAPYMT